MDNVITSEHVTEIAGGSLVTEASTLGLPPGQWPHSLKTNLGNGRPFLKVGWDANDSALYDQEFGCTRLVVLND